MVIEVTFDTTDVYISTTVSPVYVNVSFEAPSGGGAAVWGSITGTLSNQTDLQTALDGKVPYTGATQDVSLGEYGINVGNLIYDTTPTGIPTDQGATYWDDQAETVALVMNGTIQKIGEDTFYHVKNSTGSTIAKGVAVRFAGSDGASGKILIAPFLANGTYPSQYYMGITAEEILNGADGKVYHFGKIRGVNTSAFADGDILYCSTSVAGGFQTTAPSAPNNIVIAAAVINAGNNGTLMVRTTTGSNINTDEGVLLTTPTSGEVLKYNGSLWVNDSVSGALGYTPANAATTLTINGVTYDLSANRTWTISAGISGSGASGQVAYWTGTSSQSGSNNLFWDAANSRLGIGTNAPTVSLDVAGNIAVSQGFQIYNRTTVTGRVPFKLYTDATQYNGALELQRAGELAVRIASDPTTFGHSFILYGNFLLGSTTNSGQRLQVSGDTLLSGITTITPSALSGSSTTSALSISQTWNTTGNPALIYANVTNTASGLNSSLFRLDTSSSPIFTISPLGVIKFGQVQTATSGIGPINTTDGTSQANGLGLGFYMSGGSHVGYDFYFRNYTLTRTATSGVNGSIRTTVQFNPTSGNATYDIISIGNTINQVGATGVTRGLYVNPNLTAAADWRSIEWSNNSGWGLYGAGTSDNYLGGDLAIGGTTIDANIALQINSAKGVRISGSGGGFGYSIVRGSETTGIANSGSASFLFSTNTIIFQTASTEAARFNSSQRFLLGSTTDSGQRLQVQGTTLLNGNVTFSSATGMFWDAANSRLGIGTNVPSGPLHLNANLSFPNPGLVVTYSGIASSVASFQITSAASGEFLPMFLFTSNFSSPTIGGFMAGRITNSSTSDIGLVIEARTKAGAALSQGYIASFRSLSTDYVRIAHNGNMLLQNGGTFTDSGERLQVTGTMKVTDIAVFSKKNTTTTSSSLVIGDDVAFAAGSNEPKLTIGSTNSRCGLLLGQSSNRGLLFNWTYNATPANAFGVLETYGGNNPLFIQTVGGNVGINTTTDVASALLHLTSTTKGFLPPRMTTTQKNAISSPAAGLVVYDTTLNKLCVYTTAWETITSI